jgi:hypothetical protein
MFNGSASQAAFYLGEIAAIISRGRDRKARHYTCMVHTKPRLNKGSATTLLLSCESCSPLLISVDEIGKERRKGSPIKGQPLDLGIVLFKKNLTP